MDKTGKQTRQRAHGHGNGQRQPRVHAPRQQYGGNCRAQRERAVNAQIGKIQNGIGDIYAEGDQRVDQPLRQGTDQKIGHGRFLLSKK